MTEQSNIGDELRSLMTGKSSAATDTVMRRCAEKLARWQQLARKYHGQGLSRQELEEFWQEIHDKRTNVELILEITVRSSDWQQASREVKAFVDELAYEMMAADGAHRAVLETPIDSSENVNKVEENTDNSDENEIKKSFKKLLASKYGLSERTKFAAALAGLLAQAQRRLDERDETSGQRAPGAARTLREPSELLEFIGEHLAELENQTNQIVEPAPQRWRVRFFGA